MKINDLISDGSNNISITVGISDLKEFGLSLIEEGRAMGRAEREGLRGVRKPILPRMK